MPSPSQLRNGGGDTPPGFPRLAPRGSPLPNHHLHGGGHHQHAPFHSTVSAQRLRRFNALILLLRIAAFCFCLTAAVFMSTNTARTPNSPSWVDNEPFRFVLAANGIVAIYSLCEMGASFWELLKSSTLMPECLQLWFDFGHDQVFAYLLLSAEAAGTGEAVGLRKRKDTCSLENAFCVQADISIALGFVGFAFLAFAALLSGFRVGCYVVTGSRFPL